MAGRPRKVRCKDSYINSIDASTFSGPMKCGTAPKIGVTHNFWYNYQSQCNQDPNKVKKSYANMVFLNVNPAQTPVSAGFRPTTNNNYTNNMSYNSNRVSYFDANQQFDNHYYRPYDKQLQQPKPQQNTLVSKHMTGFPSR